MKSFNDFEINESIRKVKSPRFEMYYFDFNELVKEFYGHEIEIMAEEHSLYESSITFDIDGSLSDYEERDLEKFIKNGYMIPGTNRLVKDYVYPGTDTLLNDMCRKKKIEPGFYIISDY